MYCWIFGIFVATRWGSKGFLCFKPHILGRNRVGYKFSSSSLPSYSSLTCHLLPLLLQPRRSSLKTSLKNTSRAENPFKYLSGFHLGSVIRLVQSGGGRWGWMWLKRAASIGGWSAVGQVQIPFLLSAFGYVPFLNLYRPGKVQMSLYYMLNMFRECTKCNCMNWYHSQKERQETEK